MKIGVNPSPRNGMSTGTLHTLVVILSIFIVFLVFGTLWKKGYLRSKSQMEKGTHHKEY